MSAMEDHIPPSIDSSMDNVRDYHKQDYEDYNGDDNNDNDTSMQQQPGNAQHELKNRKRRRNGGYIDAHRKVETCPPLANAPMFLNDLETVYRRVILAFHAKHCLAVKRDHELEMNDVIVKKEARLPTKHITLDEQHNCDDTAYPRTLNVAMSAPLSSLSSTALNEPMSIRSNIYEKFFIHFQNFHNEHDGMAIASLLMIPCCAPDVVRDVYGWMKLQISDQQDKSSNQEEVLTMVWKRTVEGEVCYRGGFEYLFKQLPDCIMVFHFVECRHHSGGTTVIAPFSFFFTIVVPVPTTSQPTTSPSLSNDSHHKMVSVEVVGYNINYYNHDNKIIRQAQHSTLKSCSDPGLSPLDVMKAVYPNQPLISR